jgi:hypothetical protein
MSVNAIADLEPALDSKSDSPNLSLKLKYINLIREIENEQSLTKVKCLQFEIQKLEQQLFKQYIKGD